LLVHFLPQSVQAGPQFRTRGIPRTVARAHHEIYGREFMLVETEGLTHDPTDAIALHCAPYGAQCHGEANAGTTLIVPVCDHTEKSIPEAPPAGMGGFEIRLAAQAPLRGQGQPVGRGGLADQASGLRG